MVKLIILGTATNIPDASHENTHMVLLSNERKVLIDGPANPYSRLLQVGVEPNELTDLVLTHFHPDHVGGIPLLLMAMGLSGRKAPLNIYANQHCMERMLRSLEDFGWDKWHDYEIKMETLPESERHLCVQSDAFDLFTSPVKHFIPAVGLRIEPKGDGRVLAYSGDTAPVQSLDRLAEGSEILIHEAAGASAGHSSARQAGETAEKANVKDLYLVHYPVNGYDKKNLVEDVKKVFSGRVWIPEDFDEIQLA